MSKELFVTSTPHETKLAIVEDDSVVEVYFERENEYTLAGSIYKGKVTRVLPGMQSAFVEIGLERDAFLYVTDFVEGVEEENDDAEIVAKPEQDSGRREGRSSFRENRRPPRGVQSRPSSPPRESAAASNIPRSGAAARPIEFAADFTADEQAVDGQEQSDLAVANSLSHPESVSEAAGEGREPATRRWRGRRGRRRRGSQRDQPQLDAPAENLPLQAEDEGIPEIEAAQVEDPSTQPNEVDSDSSGLQEDRSRGFGRARREREARETRQSSEAPRESREAPMQRSSAGSSLLPGESLKKYGGGTQPGELSHPPLAAKTAAPHPSTLVNDPAAFTLGGAGVLAGESLRKYRGLKPHEPQIEADIPATSRVAEPGRPSELDRTKAVLEDAPRPALISPPEANEPEDAETRATDTGGGHYNFAPGAGEVEEEEIEEEEQDLHHLGEEIDEPEYEELEEETLDPNDEPTREEEMIAAGDKIAAAFAEAKRAEEEEDDQFEDDVADEEDESQEASDVETEVAASDNGPEEGELDPDDPDYEARAEVRPSPGTAAFQQRPERAERGDRNRRAGRRGRIGRRPMRSRRNIPRGPLPQINELLKEGQEILVQIAKEPMAKKGARITSHIALPGRFLVFMPTVNHTGVSRKIGSDEERRRLKQVLLSEKGDTQGGFIVRTAAAGATEDELRSDIRFLINLWGEIKQRSEASKAPALIYHDLNLVERILRDQVTANFSSVWVDSEAEYERILRFAQRFQPSLIKRVKLYTKDTPLFEQFGVQEEINKALKSKVWLKSGGYIVINQTEALVAIDINTGKFVGKTSRLEDTIVRTNIDAIQEIVRQIRLRDLGGIIIIDFIDMDERRNRQKVMQALEEALQADRSPTKVLQFNDFGLVAITRKRVKQSLERTLSTQCTYCTGTGMIKSVTTICNEIYVEFRRMHKQLEGHQVMLRVHPEVAKALKENAGRWLTEMEDLIGKTIIVKSDPAQHQEQFEIH